MVKILEVRGVKKKIANKDIINRIDFEVEEGEIFGFLGPNGAGKTTTIRMLVGLIRHDEGDIIICGENIKNKEKALNNVGAVVENPELYKYLSGRENLMQIARLRKVSKEEVQKLIELVGLKDRIDDNVGKYSLGMKQRLGLAVALIGNPKLLILDEPTNGLDPTGIVEFREILKKSVKEMGMTVFMSSHILSEIENLCDRAAFINNGVIKAIEDIKENKTIDSVDLILKVTSNMEGTLEVLRNIEDVQVVSEKSNEVHIRIKKGQTTKILEKLILCGIGIEEIFKVKKGLEQRYMELVEGELENVINSD
jgi:ABC-2 type transport system ATP-binding protein